MSEKSSPNYWLFSNKSAGAYDDNIWDMSTVLKTSCYSIKEPESNRSHVSPGDVVYMRIYGHAFIGRFVIAGEWKKAPVKQQKWKVTVGTFPMKDVVIWPRPLPQVLVMKDLSNQNYRKRINKITREDGIMIETAQRVYTRLGFGDADENILVLEKGLEEAIKPNLKKLGLKPAGKNIRQQFDMGIGVGRSDLICLDENGDLVVVELKRGLTSDEAIGQVLRYMGWLRENTAEKGQKVEGCIVAGDYDEHLRLAAAAANVRLVLVRLG
ncbi:MAG: DUF91 domain-containing protein [Actinobacteria bacterium]|nr:DUF91 domain-containing protein [Actinomycetota bacterium]MCG2817403.1 endonuclease NucS [Actinomycetes bacterium]MBU4219635.1 DUF91 domain-containing protein [Actinomycetota bacterium]MBU4359912.1 DUF91 domain-containing protein [Actinomycetota bacterium]MBU4391244.1 DUF91 domain-containing protein [Actinomycetota bacterium]